MEFVLQPETGRKESAPMTCGLPAVRAGMALDAFAGAADSWNGTSKRNKRDARVIGGARH